MCFDDRINTLRKEIIAELKKDLTLSNAYQKATIDAQKVNSSSDARVTNNVMRHEYRILSNDEKEQMRIIKDKGLDFLEYLSIIGSSREIAIAKTNVEQAVMWAVKHITK